MKILFLAALIIGSAVNKGSSQVNYREIASLQDHSVPLLELQADNNTRVLLIFPHSDDETLVAGLISHLKEKAATIHYLMLNQGPLTHENERRLAELECSCAILGIDEVEVAGFYNNTWEDVLSDNILFWYDRQDTIRDVIRNKIDSFNPDILITFDSEIGLYGHPEHRVTAHVTERIFDENMKNPSFSPQLLLQFTLPYKLEKFMITGNPAYGLAKDLTGNEGLPPPDYALDIRKYWELKNDAARCHESQVGGLRPFYVFYEEKYKQEHIEAFSKEYYTLKKRKRQ
jgi:N-acetylglucosamine malate deacetylase 2